MQTVDSDCEGVLRGVVHVVQACCSGLATSMMILVVRVDLGHSALNGVPQGGQALMSCCDSDAVDPRFQGLVLGLKNVLIGCKPVMLPGPPVPSALSETDTPCPQAGLCSVGQLYTSRSTRGPGPLDADATLVQNTSRWSRTSRQLQSGLFTVGHRVCRRHSA
eukprot:1036281-Rhodomonas_salina.1